MLTRGPLQKPLGGVRPLAITLLYNRGGVLLIGESGYLPDSGRPQSIYYIIITRPDRFILICAGFHVRLGPESENYD